MLTGCDGMTPTESVRFDAELACYDKWNAEFLVVEDETSLHDFHVDAKGSFVFAATTPGKGPPRSSITCHGNVNERTVQSVEFNGVIRRPSNQQVWKF